MEDDYAAVRRRRRGPGYGVSGPCTCGTGLVVHFFGNHRDVGGDACRSQLHNLHIFVGIDARKAQTHDLSIKNGEIVLHDFEGSSHLLL